MRKREWVGPLYALLFTWLIATFTGVLIHQNRYEPLDKTFLSS